ncbi:MAG: DUF881 domain-containing protein [Clostridiales Family XIII bacterium]|nr:DUF881 domain-containing protein [Clostridiales Family XIII bacterium]
MNKYGGMLVVSLLAVCIGFAISVQITSGEMPDQGGLVPIGKVAPYQDELERLQLERDAMTEDLRVKEERLAAYEKEAAEEDTFFATTLSELERYKMAAGVVDVVGPGLIITLDDPLPMEGAEQDRYSEIMTHFELLLGLVNRLKEAGAEAVSINGHRVVNLTEIVLAGDNVNINARATAPPYKILAIGDPDTMDSAINIKHGIMSTIKYYSIRVSIEKSDTVNIARYNGSVTGFRYARAVEEAGQ